MLGLLWWMQDRTRWGAIIRAGMDNKEMTIGLGVNYGLVSTLVFLLGVALAGLAGVLGAPILGAYPSMGDNLLLLTLIVVVVGGTGYIQGTMLGALVIGLLDTFGKAYIPEAGAVLRLHLLHRRSCSSAEWADRQEGVLMADEIAAYRKMRPPRRPCATPGRERAKPRSPLIEVGLPVLVIGILVLILPLFIPSFVSSLVTKMMIYGLFGMSLNILWGYAGIPSFGHAAFFGVGGYAAGVLVLKVGISNFWLNLLLAIIVTALVAAILGVPAFRVFGVGAGNANPIYFLLATIAFGEILSRVAISVRPVTGGSTGLAGIPEPDLGLGFDMTSGRYYYLVFFVTVVCVYIMYRIVNSRYGYALRGIHDNERRMQALGYNTWLYKYTSWIIAAVFGGVAGVMFAYFGGIMHPNNLAMITSDIAFLIVILGSATIFFGPLVASMLYVGIEYLASLYLPDRWPLILGALFVVTIMVIPEGLGVWILKGWRRLIRGAA